MKRILRRLAGVPGALWGRIDGQGVTRRQAFGAILVVLTLMGAGFTVGLHIIGANAAERRQQIRAEGDRLEALVHEGAVNSCGRDNITAANIRGVLEPRLPGEAPRFPTVDCELFATTGQIVLAADQRVDRRDGAPGVPVPRSQARPPIPVPGERGEQGPAGEQGATGRQGPRGATGRPGLRGPAGPQGPAGPAGAQGPAAPAGPQGPAGEPGTAGAPPSSEALVAAFGQAFDALLDPLRGRVLAAETALGDLQTWRAGAELVIASHEARIAALEAALAPPAPAVP